MRSNTSRFPFIRTRKSKYLTSIIYESSENRVLRLGMVKYRNLAG